MEKIVLTALVKRKCKLIIRTSDSFSNNSINILCYYFSLPVLVSAMYVRKYFQRNSKEVAQKMVKEIVLEFRRILKESFWMDKETREKALQKLDAMSTYIGYPDWLMNDSEIEKLYKDLEIDENSYVASLLSINKFTTDHQFRELRKPPKRDDWFMEIPPFGINAGSLLIKNGLREKENGNFK